MKKPEVKENENAKRKSTPITVNNFGVSKVKLWEPSSVTFDLELNGIKIYGCRVVEYDKGDFISFPSRKGSDGKWYSIVFAQLSDEDTKTILAEVERQLNS